MRYFFHIAYNGQFFNGWQRHPKARSVQEAIESKLSEMFKTPIAIVGCGRTDTHVHASQFFFHADIEQEWDFDIVFRLNKLLPYNISVYDVIRVEEKQHARFDAVQRKYDFILHTRPDPFLTHLSTYYSGSFDASLMNKAVALLTSYKDYRAFCTSPDKYEHTICNVHHAELFTNSEGDKLRFHIASNRFLTRMIRIIMGQLLNVGSGELSVGEFESFLAERRTPKELDPAQPNGLYLSKVTYPYLNLPPRANVALDHNWIAI